MTMSVESKKNQMQEKEQKHRWHQVWPKCIQRQWEMSSQSPFDALNQTPCNNVQHSYSVLHNISLKTEFHRDSDCAIYLDLKTVV